VRQLRNFAERMAALKRTGLIDENDVNRFLAEQHVSARHLPVSTGKTIEEAGQELIYRAILSLGNEIKLLRDLIVSNLPGEQVVHEENRPIDELGGQTMDKVEEEMIKRTLRETKGNRKEAARRLGIGERTLYRKLNKYQLS
jgi:DNA-binding NtrC family response regulator